MTAWIKQSTTTTVKMGPFLDATDGVTEETALTPGVEVSKDGAAFAARNSATAVAHDAEGWYDVELDTTDTNTLGTLVVKAQDSATHLPVWHQFLVVPANVYDSLVAGSDALQVDATEISSSSVAADNVEANITNLDAAITSLNDPTAATIADAVWDEAKSGHVAAGSFGEEVQDHALSSEITALNDPTAASIADAVWDEAAADHVGAGSFGEEVQAHALSSEITALNDFDPANDDVSVRELQATALADMFNTDSLTDYASAVAGSVVKETADNAGGSSLTEAGIADAVWDEAAADHVAAGSFGEEVQLHALSTELFDPASDQVTVATNNDKTGYDLAGTINTFDDYAIHIGTAQGSDGADLITLDSGASATSDIYNDEFIRIVSGTGADQVRKILDYNGSTKVLQVSKDWTTAPDATSVFAILPSAIENVSHIQNVALDTPNASGYISSNLRHVTPDALADFFNTDSGETYATAVAGSVVKETADNAGGSSLTLADIADAVWDEAQADHVAAGSTGESLDDASTAGASAADVADAVWDEVIADHVGAGSFGEEVQAHATSAEITALNDLSAAEVNAEVDTALADYDAPTKAEMDAAIDALNDPTAAVIADAVWDEAQADHVAAGSFGEIASEIASILTDTDTTIPDLINALNDLSAADVNAEVLDVMNTDTFAELSSVPGSTPTLVQAIMLGYMALRNKVDVTSTAKEIHNDAGTVLGTKSLSDDGTTYIETKMS